MIQDEGWLIGVLGWCSNEKQKEMGLELMGETKIVKVRGKGKDKDVTKERRKGRKEGKRKKSEEGISRRGKQ